MTQTKQQDSVDIKLRKVTGKKKDGTDFQVWETIDKNKNRLSVRFTKDCKPTEPKVSCTIRLRNFNTDYWLDKRKVFPILRIRNFEIVTDITDKKDVENPFI